MTLEHVGGTGVLERFAAELRAAGGAVVEAWRAGEPETPESARMRRLARLVERKQPVGELFGKAALDLSTPTRVCAAHRSHSPRNLTLEFHHVIPVAWQLHTPLAPGVQPPSPGPDTDGRGMLWDDRGVWICPTGHRNVHAWIVAMMHAIANAAKDDPEAAYRAVKPRRAPVELPIALEALIRYEPYGSLLALTAASEWGQV